ncbi:MAG: hypothetical protein ACM3RQ_00880 [Methanocella sp.]
MSRQSNERPSYDPELIDIADYVTQYRVESELAYSTARYCLMDTLGCGHNRKGDQRTAVRT